jgi:peroxiredoxin
MKSRVAVWLIGAIIGLPGWALAAPQIGRLAPDFLGSDSNGLSVRLSDLKGKVVVLEWTNNGCPYCQKWYSSGAMQALQRDARAKGVVWLTVVSSAAGEQGYVDGAHANRDIHDRHAAPDRVLLDPRGTIGHLYGAVTTPEIFVIKADGVLAYAGGADSIASADPGDLARAEPYAREAISAVVAGQPVAHPVTRPYGCSVKYAD